MTKSRKPSSAALWLMLWRDLSRGAKVRLGVAGCAMLIGSIATAATPSLVGNFVDAVYRNGKLVSLTDAWLPIILLAVAAFLIGATGLVRHQQIHAVTTSFTATARERIYNALLRWELSRYVDEAKGALYGRANRSIEGAERLIKLGASDLLPAVLVTVFAVVIAVVQYGLLSLTMVAVVPTGFALVLWQIHSQRGIRVEVVEAKERIDADVTSWLQGIDVIRTLGVEKFFASRIEGRVSTLMRRERRHHFAMANFDAIKLANETVWLVVTLAFALSFGTFASAGDIAGVVLLYLAITRPLADLHRVIDEGSEAALQTAQLKEALDAPHDPSYEVGDQIAGPPQPGPRRVSALSLEGLHYRHPGAAYSVLQNVTGEIYPGERIGVVGASGCGKSTLLKLIARLTHGYSGSIRVGERDIQLMDRAELVHAVGYVGQRATLFQGTIRENLTLGRDISDDELVRACIRANIHQDILVMPDGYDTVVGEEGARLSGGQSQRLCLARALVAAPPLLMLDEPTSALDAPSQAVVQAAIDELEDVTMVIVAHRLSTLRTTDRILVLEAGQIVEAGSYDELAALGGRFAAMLESERRAA